MLALLSIYENEDTARRLCQSFEDHTDYLFSSIDLGFDTSAELHRSNARTHGVIWSQFKCNKTCLYCLQRTPEHVMTCGHAICDTCLVIFGRRIVNWPCHYQLDSCILCTNGASVTARLKPPTAGARILSIDGGGVRGIVPLEYLNLLQQMLGSGIRIQDLFDVGFGTSSGDTPLPPTLPKANTVLGGLVVIGLFLKYWEVGTCMHLFETLVKDFFGIQMDVMMFSCWSNH